MDMAIGLMSLAAVALLTRQCLRVKSRAGQSRQLYEDEDGVATQGLEAEARKSASVKFFLNAAAAIGASMAILDVRRSSNTGQWSLPAAAVSRVGIWLLLATQALTIANEVGTRERYRLGICAAISTAILMMYVTYSESRMELDLSIWTAEKVCALAIGLCSLTLPRSPAVYKDGRPVDHQSGTSIISLLSFSWYPLYRPEFLELESLSLRALPILPLSQRIRTAQRNFIQCASSDRLLSQLIWTWRHSLFLQWSLTLLHSASQFAGQYLLQRLLGSLERPFAQQQYTMGYALSLGLALLLENMSAGWTTWVTQAKLTIPMTALLKGVLFENMTRRRSSHQAAPQAAKRKDVLSLGSLMSNDCASVSQACISSQHCLKAAFKLLFDVTYLVHLIGLKHIVIGSLFPVILFPLSKMLAHQHRLAKLELSHLHTAFSSEVSELLRSMRQIRLSSMEELWQQRVTESRARELRQIWHCGMILAMLTLAANLGPVLLIAVSLSSYALQVGHLSPSLAFASIGLFRNLHAVFQELPATVASLQESFAASKRIEKYLHQSTKTRVHDSVDLTTLEDVKITWPNSNIAVGSSSSSFSLNNVNLHFPEGRLSIITGKTSSGKGLLLSALLGEADIEAEKSNLDFESVATKQMKTPTPDFAYVSQPPWIENRAIQENIIFGNRFDEDRYMAVLRACALERDLETLPRGDMAKAGVNGGTLSGGQKWRVSLARALYSRARVLVLDDVLSAVDPHVATWLCQHALSGPLVRGRTVIIATHHPATCMHLASYLVTVDAGTASGRAVTPRRDYGLLNIDIMPRSATSSPKPDPLAHSIDAHKKHPAISRRSVLRIFAIYLLGSGPWPVLLAVLTTLACRLLAAGNSWWLTKWTSNKELDEMSLRSSLYIYLALSVCAAVAVAVHAMAVQGVSQRASDVLFQKTVQNVICSPLRWIDSTSLGKPLHSLASDIYLVDHRVAAGLSDLLRIFMQLILVVFTSGVATPQTIAMMVIMMSFYFKITTRHLGVSKRLNKLIPLAAQPILEHTNSAESGITTIRAFKKEPIYVKRMYDLLDVDMGLSWHITLGQRWIHGRYGILGSLFVCATAVSLVLTGADAATAGFTINVAIQFKATMSGLMGKINLLTSGARAIDRVLDIAEAPTERQGGEDAAASWPASGRLEVKDVTVRYDADLPPVLRGITFSLAARERVGVVGRTGAGKTSLVNALLRFIDVEKGSIHVDGVDTASLKLARLRSSISVIPQDPFLFSGTLRANLAIRGPRSDEELRAALRKVSVQTTDGQDAADLFDNLDMAVQAGGENLSHGQKQMVCLARAILSPRRIVILDEATSAVDRATDIMVQEVIRREFAESSMIIVAHRLATVADLDKVMVLDEGMAVEIGSPTELMQKKGVFWDMVNQSGDADNVRRVIEKAGG
ncbi:ABC transporter, transmembrane domain, type 1 [Beauveria brongniartii RCEF 3172]|uniref:ABC transporter, transmembrane domain, type 1 n=1 Tax=Beauveria brongniartii RCEF 3172 TaxID=1081107 RepID=A0A167KUI7_9HYPO|nr:ABC transporter, transmembrane domain, type 1 [Beauveria brongniartii RCEF 3172]